MNDEDFKRTIEEELNDLIKLVDRKADSTSVVQYVAMYEKKRKIRNSIQPPRVSFKDGIIDKPKKTQNYNFGNNLATDFSNLFSIFNRVAKAKLDNVILSEYASHSYTDTLFKKISMNFSAQLRQNSEIYYLQIDGRLTKLQERFNIFQTNVDFLLTRIETRIKRIKQNLNKVYTRFRIDSVGGSQFDGGKIRVQRSGFLGSDFQRPSPPESRHGSRPISAEMSKSRLLLLEEFERQAGRLLDDEK